MESCGLLVRIPRGPSKRGAIPHHDLEDSTQIFVDVKISNLSKGMGTI